MNTLYWFLHLFISYVNWVDIHSCPALQVQILERRDSILSIKNNKSKKEIGREFENDGDTVYYGDYSEAISIEKYTSNNYNGFSSRETNDNQILKNRRSKKKEQITFDKFHNLKTHFKYLDRLGKKYPFVNLKTIGMSYEKRPIQVLQVCKGGCNNGKKAIWIDSGVHPREWITTASVSWLIKELVENDEKHPHLIEKFNWHILLIANPDGYSWTFAPDGDRNWRKNRNPENEAECPAPSEVKSAGGYGFGTDLNRNWGFSFQNQKDSNKCKSSYCGKSAFSELETQAVRDYLLPMKNNVFLSNSIHAAGEFILIPYGHTRTPHPRAEKMKKFLALGRDAMTPYVGGRYKIGSVPTVLDIVANGGSINWHAAVLNVTFPMGMELTNKKKYGHNPPPSIIKDIGRGIFEFHKALVENSDNYNN